MTALEVAFLYPPYEWQDLDFKILLLRSWLESRGLSTAEVIRRDDEDFGKLVERIARLAPRLFVVHLGWWGRLFAPFHRRFTFGLLSAMRPRLPGTRFLACGDLALYSPRELLGLCPSLDACVTGDAFVVLEAAARSEGPSGLAGPGIATREGRTPDPPPLAGSPSAELDGIPSPFHGIANASNYDFTYSTAFGCPYACSYCMTRTYEGTVLRRFSVARVIDDLHRIGALLRRRTRAATSALPRSACDLRAARRYSGPAASISIEDQTFSVDRERTLAICRALAAHPVGVPLACTTRPDLIDEEILDALVSAGFRGISLGIDSLELSALRRTGRLNRLDGGPTTSADPADYVRRVKRGIDLVKQRRLPLFLSCVLGLPGSSRRADERMATRLATVSGGVMQANPYVLLPGPLRRPLNGQRRPTRVEGPLPWRRLEQLQLPSQVVGFTLLEGQLDRLISEIDATRTATPFARPVTLVLTDDVDVSAIAPALSSGAHGVVLGNRELGQRLRRALPALPILALIGHEESPSRDAEHRFEVRTRRVALSDLVDRRGRLDVRRLATPPQPPIGYREEGAVVVETSGREALRSLVRLSRAARRGLWVDLPLEVEGSLVLLPGACAMSGSGPPEAPLRRIWISGGELRGCPSGPVLGSARSDLAHVSRVHGGAVAAARRRRGCAGCEARSFCPACPCAGGVAERVYCEVMRSLAPLGPAPLEVLRYLPLLSKTFSRWATGARAELLVPAVARLAGPSRRKWACLGAAGASFAQRPAATALVRADRTRFLLIGPMGAAEIPPPAAAAIARAQRGAAPGEVARDMARVTGASFAAGRRALASVLDVFTTLAGELV